MIELTSAYRAVFAAAFNQLDDTEPVEAMVARELATLRHRFFADRAFLSLRVLAAETDYRVIIIQVL